MIDRMRKLTPVHVWLLSIFISVVIAECIVAALGILLTGEIVHDYLIAGFVTSLFAGGLAGGFLNFFLIRRRKIEAELHISAAAQEVQSGTEATGTTATEDAGKIGDYAAMPPLITERKSTEEPIRENKHPDIRLGIRKLEALPAMPLIAQKLLALKLDTEEDERMLLVLIEQDPQISAKLLGLANSAMIGASRPIKTTRDAAMLLGTKRVQSVAAGIAIISLMTSPPPGEFNIHDLWLHSLGVAFAMQGLAQFMPESIRPQDDHIFLAGMLHDIGYLALAYLDPNRSDRLHNHLSAQPSRPSLEVEREILDICHDELGAELALHWNLPNEIITVLRYHHTPDAVESAEGQPLVRMINIVEKLQPSFGIIEYVGPEVSVEEWTELGIDPSRAGEVKERVAEQLERAIQLSSSFN